MKRWIRRTSVALFLLAVGGTGGHEVRAQDVTLPAAGTSWLLQLPTGEVINPCAPDSCSSRPYYRAAQDGGHIFMVPREGKPTSGSKHCRTEMRESTSWKASATNSMTVTGQVLRVGRGSKGLGLVTVGQVFNGTDSIPLAELQYSTKVQGFVLLYEEAKGKGSTTPLKTGIPLKSKYTFTMSLTNNVLTILINGESVHTHRPSTSILENDFYFKYGNYDQTTTAGHPTTIPYTEVENYSVSVVHE
jgi:hypothetical protein